MSLLKSPHRVSVGASYQQHEDIEQRCYFADHLSHKEALLAYLLKQEQISQLIIFIIYYQCIHIYPSGKEILGYLWLNAIGATLTIGLASLVQFLSKSKLN